MKISRQSKITAGYDPNGYKYISKHGLGPGMLPRDVEVIDWRDLPNYKTEIVLSRPLTYQEMQNYEITYPPVEECNQTGSKISASREYKEHLFYERSGSRFSIYIFNDDPLYPKFQITQSHPYDDAEYFWARCGYKGTALVEFIKQQKVVDRMQWRTYDDEDYEDGTEYLNEILDQTCIELRFMNSSIEPRIIHD